MKKNKLPQFLLNQKEEAAMDLISNAIIDLIIAKPLTGLYNKVKYNRCEISSLIGYFYAGSIMQTDVSVEFKYLEVIN